MTQTKTQGHSWEAHTKIQANGATAMCLEDAFPTAALVLDGHANVEEVVAALNDYCTFLVETGTPHMREDMVRWCFQRNIL
jgi:hypothetical protein